MKLNKTQSNILLKEMYIADRGVVDFNIPSSLYSDIMLISASCGRGKTTFSLSLSPFGLLDQINKIRHRNNLFIPDLQDIKPEEVLFLTSRKSTKHQQLSNKNTIQAIPDDFSNNLFEFEKTNRNNKIRVATAHQFGSWVKNDLIKINPKIIILDELHSIISETIFADDLLYVIEFLKEYYNDIIKIGLTATPQFLFDYIEDDILKFRVVDKNLNSKYKCNNIKAFIRGQADSILKQIKPKINSKNKVIFYTQSAKQCYKLSQEYGEKSSFLISDYNETKIDEKKLVDIMNEQGVKEYILKNEKFPDNIDIIFINSACREGMNIKDKNVKTIICESVDMITIEQILGRIRNDLEEFIVVCNYNHFEKVNKNIKDFLQFAEELSKAEYPMIELGKRYGRQQENKNLQKYVYVYKGEYKLNQYAKSYLKYIQESYIQISNYETKDKMNYISKVGNRDLLLSNDYLGQLSRYAVNNSICVEQVWKAIVEENHNNVIEVFQKIENEWLDKPLTKEDKEKLVADLHIIRSCGKSAKWNTIKELLLNNGYIIADKRIGKDRKTVSYILKNG